MNATVDIDKAGRIVVPKKMRDAMHLRAGDRLSVECTGESLVFAPEAKSRGLYRDRGWLVYDSGVSLSTEESLRMIDDEREARMRFLSGESPEP